MWKIAVGILGLVGVAIVLGKLFAGPELNWNDEEQARHYLEATAQAQTEWWLSGGFAKESNWRHLTLTPERRRSLERTPVVFITLRCDSLFYAYQQRLDGTDTVITRGWAEASEVAAKDDNTGLITIVLGAPPSLFLGVQGLSEATEELSAADQRIAIGAAVVLGVASAAASYMTYSKLHHVHCETAAMQKVLSSQQEYRQIAARRQSPWVDSVRKWFTQSVAQ